MKGSARARCACLTLLLWTISRIAIGAEPASTNAQTVLFAGRPVDVVREGGDLSACFQRAQTAARRDNRVPIPHGRDDVFLDFNGEIVTWGQIDDHIDLHFLTDPLNIPSIATADEVKQILTLTRNKYAARYGELYVRNAILGQVARARGFSVSAAELSTALTNAVRHLSPKVRDRVLAGISAEGSYFRRDEENYLLTVKYRKEVLMKEVVVTEAETDEALAEYDADRARTIRENAEMRPTMERWLADIKSGKRAFSEIAEEHSDCESRLEAGEMGVFSRDCLLRPELKRFAFSPETNALSGVIETERAYHILKVVARYYDQASAESAENPDMGVSDADEEDEVSQVSAADGVKADAAVPTAVRLAQIMLEKNEIPEKKGRDEIRKTVLNRKLGKLTVAAQQKALESARLTSVFPIRLEPRQREK